MVRCGDRLVMQCYKNADTPRTLVFKGYSTLNQRSQKCICRKMSKKNLFAKSLPWKAGAGLSGVTNEMRHFLFLQRKFLLKSSQKNGTYCNSKSRPLRKGDTHKSRSIHNFFKPPKHSFCKLCFGDGIQNKAPRSSVCAQTFVLSISQQGGAKT